jgi:hypothetical protein
VCCPGISHRFCDTKIDHQCVAVGDHYVVGLDVPVNHSLFVRVHERIDDLTKQARRF